MDPWLVVAVIVFILSATGITAQVLAHKQEIKLRVLQHGLDKDKPATVEPTKSVTVNEYPPSRSAYRYGDPDR